ncbi:hypothetical protein NECAME_03755 [Necator americanus]|uniref:N-acetyltransferase domain-containing protein n=1 Tax=Necator americanus TaxID=51031 RepID=W2T0N1_NECAM|nr:hypothetical protein NECAME_03755 [Necator americanus]ETN75565.1 hypothetical protein NECAME_03755 [Necator americanus]
MNSAMVVRRDPFRTANFLMGICRTLNQYRTEVATQKHANDIHGFMLAEYVVNEPIANSLGVTRYDVEDLFDDMAKDGYSNEKYSTVVYDQDSRGIAKALTRKAIELARSEGCDWVASAVTSFQSEEILRKMQFQTLYEIPFEIFREYGQPVFNHLPDFGDSGKFMALRLKSKN